MPNFFWTPHSGYHWQGGDRRFFEGWYFRLTLPEAGESFAFMYSIDDPAGSSPLSGGDAQILGPGEGYLHCHLPHVNQFWAWPHRLGLGHWGRMTRPLKEACHLLPAAFTATVQQGYQVTATHHQGCLQDAATGAIAQWDYAIEPVYGWGNRPGPQLATAGWLSYLPIFEPGWQVLMAHGRATGWAEWQGHRYEFQQAPVYAEKNWGGAFPDRWFWLQANAFDDAPDLALTAVGGRRQVLGRLETVGLIGVHWCDQLIALSSLNTAMSWYVTPWGHWQMTAHDYRYRIVLSGKAESPPAQVQVPILEGLCWDCWDTTHGRLQLKVWARSRAGSDPETLILQAHTSLAGLEVGGQGWHQDWRFTQA